MADNAAEACKKISSEAENIKSGFDGAIGVADSIGAAFTFGLSRLGKDLAAENDLKESVRNIMKIDLSSNDVMKIQNDCFQSTSFEQKNIIGNEFGKESPGCVAVKLALANKGIVVSYKNITQRNKADFETKCVMQSMIDVLSKKEANTQTLAASKVLQEAEGLLTKQETGKDACNIVDKDMSSNDYYENIQKCDQEVFSKQLNQIFECGIAMENVIQDNIASAKQECLMQAGVIKETETKDESDNIIESETEQKAEGLTTTAMLGSSLSILLSCCSLFILLSVLGFFASSVVENQ